MNDSHGKRLWRGDSVLVKSKDGRGRVRHRLGSVVSTGRKYVRVFFETDQRIETLDPQSVERFLG